MAAEVKTGVARRAAGAKINLFLHVGGRRADGFHPLQSLAVFADLGDTLAADDAVGLSLAVGGPFAASLSGEPDNLVLRAARALAQKAGRAPDAALTLTKNLPVASGIGGGSADAAAALGALSALWRLDLDEAALCEVAASLGSDVPVCVASRPSWMEGRGEILRSPASMPHLAILLVNPGVAVATADVFAALEDRSGIAMKFPSGGFTEMADILCFLDATRNDLEAPARRLQPQIGAVLDALKNLPGALFSRMSGSGATCFALFPDDEGCARAAAMLRAARPGWWVAPSFVPEFQIAHGIQSRDIGPTDNGL